MKIEDILQPGGSIYTQLASTALAVLKYRVEGAWCVYVAGVPGINHRQEWQEVLDHGDKLDEDTALAVIKHRFHPGLEPGELPYAN